MPIIGSEYMFEKSIIKTILFLFWREHQQYCRARAEQGHCYV